MAINPWEKSRFQSEINITPLADVTLSLLILFLVITPIIVYSFQTNLPSTAAGMPSSGQIEQDLVVSITAENVVQLDGEPVTDEQLRERLAEVFGPGSLREPKVVFDGDPKARYESVIEVMDILRQHGIEAIGIR